MTKHKVRRLNMENRIKELSKEEIEYRKKLKQMAQSGIDMAGRDYVPSNNFADWYADSLSAMAQLCIAANLVTLTESVEKLTDKINEQIKSV